MAGNRLLLQEKDCRNYLLLGTACLMCGPFPFVGLVILWWCAALFCWHSVKRRAAIGVLPG